MMKFSDGSLEEIILTPDLSSGCDSFHVLNTVHSFLTFSLEPSVLSVLSFQIIIWLYYVLDAHHIYFSVSCNQTGIKGK